MSEYHIIETSFKDEPVLVQTLKEMGYQPEVHSNAKNLYGFQEKKEIKKLILLFLVLK